jgi:membrane protease YdiL (CAAX protease family)
MNPKYKPLIFVLLVFVLLVPYLGFVLYYSPQFPPNQWPSWFTNTIAIWFVVNFLILMLLGKRIFRGQPAEAVEPQKVRRASRILQVFGGYLVIVWSILFLYGLRETIRGEIPLTRAIPAGAFLLFFIVTFSWSIYRARQRKV